MFHLGDICPKTGQPVLEVPRLKHPKACTPTARSFEAYRGKTLVFVRVDIKYKTMASVAR